MRTLYSWPITSQAGALTSEPAGQTAQRATEATNKPYQVVEYVFRWICKSHPEKNIMLKTRCGE